MTKKINKDLTAEQKLVLFEDGTEAPGTSELNHEKREGDYLCAACGTKLFESKNKYEIQLENNKLIITPNSTFILFNDNLFNGLYPTLEIENDILIPVNDIITLLNNNELYIMFISTDDKYLLTNLKNYNVKKTKNV